MLKMGYKIKEYREKLGMTQEQLAKKSGISRATISALEKGAARATSTKTLDKIAQALGTTIDAIFFSQSV